MNTEDVIDLAIIDGDLSLDTAAEPQLFESITAVAQDLKHKLIESQYLLQLVAERDPAKRRAILKKIKILVENDLRIKPGTTDVTEIEPGVLSISAVGLSGDFIEVTV